MKIAILEDDPAQAALISDWLKDENHEVSHESLCSDFLKTFKLESPDLAILDWQLPDQTGMDVLVTLRKQYDSAVPVVFCTQRNAEEDIVDALKLGADDFLTKPIRKGELLARLDAIIRRAGLEAAKDSIEIGPIKYDGTHEHFTLNDEVVKMTKKDFLVGQCLFKNLGKVVSREYLLKTVWGVNADLDTRTVDVHVSRVRRSLKITPEMGYAIKTIYQHGYRLEKLDH